MTVFNRILYLYPKDNSQAADIYLAVSLALYSHSVSYFPQADLPDWPNGSYQEQDLMVKYSEWVAKTAMSGRLLQVTLSWSGSNNNAPWEADICIGTSREGAVIVTEAWQLTTYQLQVRYDQMPGLLDFLSGFACKNEDGYWAGKLYTVGTDRVESFVAFLQSSERHLPVVLISPKSVYSHTQSIIQKELTTRLWGLAHVIRLQDDRAVSRLQQLLPEHSCYNGAIRLYWPGFNQNDPPSKHPYRLPEEYQDIATNIFARLAEESPRLFGYNAEIRNLKQQREAEHQETARKGLALMRQKMEAEKRIEEYEELFEVLEQDDKNQGNRLAEQEVELNQLRNENRQLRWRLNSVWQTQGMINEEEESQPRLWLSAVAYERYSSFDRGETRYWDRNIFRKLLDRQYRDSQSEPMKAQGSEPCFVYPRAKSADGRRVFYYCQNEDVYVCAIFQANEHNGEYARIRNMGVDREIYSAFQVWEMNETIIREEESTYDVGSK